MARMFSSRSTWRVVIAGAFLLGTVSAGRTARAFPEGGRPDESELDAADRLAIPLDQFEQVVFGEHGPTAEEYCRSRFDKQLVRKIAGIGLACEFADCSLTDSQAQKLRLAAKSDMERWFYHAYELERMNHLNPGDYADVVQAKLHREVISLQQSSRSGLFESGSRFERTLRRQLTTDQQAICDTYREIMRWDGILRARLPDGQSANAAQPAQNKSANVDSRYRGWQQDLAGLKVRSNRFSDSQLANVALFKRLERLELGGTQIRGTGLAHLQAMKNLRFLDLQGTPLDDEGLRHLPPLASLRVLHLGWTNISTEGLAHLASLKSIEILLLYQTRASDTGLSKLKGLQNLTELGLDGTEVTDAGMTHLGALTNLRVLSLNGTSVTDTGLSHLAGLRKLQSLDVRGTEVTEAGVADLKQSLPQLTICR